ncbi:MAG: polysaccharide pyruvyl transferase family protein [Bryobacterales bacterium]|nr:polysaccharide pyruvyl transferase family protein [Bryobacterales bacterium]
MSASKTVFLAGYYGFGNAGDEIILGTIAAQLRRRCPDVAFCVTTGSGEASLPGAEPVLWSDPIAMSAAIARSDLVVLGGGGLFHDYWGFDPNNALAFGHWGVSYYTAPAVFGALHAKPVMLYGVGAGPLFSAHGKAFTKAVCDAADVVTVRDEGSAALLREIGVEAGHVEVTGDPAFAFEPDPALGKRLRDSLAPDSPVIAVVVRPWEFGVSPSFWEREVARALDLYLQKHPGKAIFIPFQHLERLQENDFAVAERTRSYMQLKERASLAPATLTPEEKFSLVGGCDLVLGMRLHSVLAAVRAGVPCIPIVYDPKVDSVVRQVGLERFSVALGGLVASELAGLLGAALDTRMEFHKAAEKLRRELAPRAEQAADLAIGLMEGRPREVRFSPQLATVILRTLERQNEDVRWLTGEREQLTATAAALRDEMTSAWGALGTQSQGTLREAIEARLARDDELREHAGARLQQLAALEQDYAKYRSDKEDYIAVLTASLEAARRRPWFVALSLLAQGKEALWEIAVGLLPRQTRALIHGFGKDLLTLEPKSRVRMASSMRAAERRRVAVSLIATVFNEAASIGGWLESLVRLSRHPDELVIVDAGSTDGTVEAIRRFGETAPFSVEVIVEPGANIARGRNVAIHHARHAVIACTDAGCRVHPLWLESLIGPFEADPETEVVAGWTEPKVRNPFERTVAELFVARRHAVDFHSYLPSSRTIAFARQAFEAVGGYPEWLTMWAEDTYFATRLRNESSHWVAQPDAIVYWESRPTWRAVAKQAYRYGYGDGEAGLHGGGYVADWRILRRAAILLAVLAAALAAVSLLPPGFRSIAVVAVLAGAAVYFANRVRAADRAYGGSKDASWVDSLRKVGLLYVVIASRVAGYVQGIRNRPAITQKRYAGVQGAAVIFSGVPIDDSGGGQRATQLALELLDQGWRVVFLNRYPRYETVDLKLRIAHPRLETYPLDTFDAGWFLSTLLPDHPAFAIAEFPHPDFATPLQQLRAGGVTIFYDLIDDWRSSLGGDWYSLATEQEFVQFSHHLLASAASLADRLRAMGANEVHYVPNAVNRRLFSWRPHPRPADMPEAEFTILYVGALWGHWFDWQLLLDVAHAYPKAAVVVIGDYHGQCPGQTPNLHFLGLKAQRDLPPYLANANVALIPFKPSELTQAVSPLKVFEYLAMKLPVVSTPLKELEQLPYVTLAATPALFVEAVGRARWEQVDDGVIEGFLSQNSWSARVQQILSLTGPQETVARNLAAFSSEAQG